MTRSKHDTRDSRPSHTRQQQLQVYMLEVHAQAFEAMQLQGLHLGGSVFCIEHGHHQRGNAHTEAQKHAANHQHGNVNSAGHDGGTSHEEDAGDQERDLERWVWLR